MSEAIYTGLKYGVIAGFGTVGFALTIASLWFLLELLTKLFGIYEHIFDDSSGGYDGSKRGRKF